MIPTNKTVSFVQPRDVKTLGQCFYYHTMELPGIGLIEGEWDLRGQFDEYIGHVPMDGKTVLDVGTASGFLTFEAEKRGGTVVSFDIGHGKYQHLLPFKDKLYYQNHFRWAKETTAVFERWKNAYWMAHKLFQSKAKVYYGNIYELPIGLGQFDVVLIGSVLEHLSDPISALASISKLVRSQIVIVTDLLEDDNPMARFEGKASRPEHDYTWWTYSRGIYREVLAMLGFRIEATSRSAYQCNVARRKLERTTIVGTRER